MGAVAPFNNYVANPTYTYGLRTPFTYTYGKREAEAEADPLTYLTYGAHFPLTYAADVYAPCVNAANEPVACAHGYHYMGKREAEAEPEPYTIGQVLTGQVAPGSVVKSITYGHGLGAVLPLLSPTRSP